MEPETKVVAVKDAEGKAEVGAVGAKPKNLYNKMEWAGAFGDVGTLIPFVVAYITIVKINPLGLLFMFGIPFSLGILLPDPASDPTHESYRSSGHCRGHQPGGPFGSGLTTGLFWLLAGLTGAIRPIAKLATKPVVRGIMLGFGFPSWSMVSTVWGLHRCWRVLPWWSPTSF